MTKRRRTGRLRTIRRRKITRSTIRRRILRGRTIRRSRIKLRTIRGRTCNFKTKEIFDGGHERGGQLNRGHQYGGY